MDDKLQKEYGECLSELIQAEDNLKEKTGEYSALMTEAKDLMADLTNKINLARAEIDNAHNVFMGCRSNADAKFKELKESMR